MKHGDFTELAGLYHNRPAYNPLMIEKLLACINDGKKPLNELDIAEVGAGTGKLTAILARDFGLKITAVEPNDAMREEGIKATQGLNIKWLKGSGEQTNLPSNSADWLIMASSFHWTDPTKSLPEFARVLRGGNSQSDEILTDKPRNERERERDGFAKIYLKFTNTLSKPREKFTKLISYNYLQPTRYKARVCVL